MSIELKYLVVGTGRCGTVFTARLLTKLGINCGHEAIFDWRGLNHALNVINNKIPIETSICSQGEWFNSEVVAESSYMAIPYLENKILKNTKIIHITRDPLCVISSFSKDIKFFERIDELKKYENFIYKNLPELKNKKTPLEKVCFYCIEWNRLIEKRCKDKKYIRIKVEDLPNKKLFDFLEIPSQNCVLENNINSWKKREKDYELHEIPESIRDSLIELMKNYDYEVKNKIKLFL